MTAPTSAGADTRGAWRFGIVLLAILVVVVLVAGAGVEEDSGEPLAPNGTGPDGAKAMVDLLEELGSRVDRAPGAPDPSATSAVLLEDRLGDARRSEILDWVHRGGVLVVADPASPLTPEVTGLTAELGGLVEGPLDRGDCGIDNLAAASTVRPGNGALYGVPLDASSCFGDGSDAFVVTADVGAGAIVAVGGVHPFTNAGLPEDDNAVLVADLVAPSPTRVAFLTQAPAVAGEGEDGLLDLVPVRVMQALAQLGIAFLAYVWFRARRLGRPVLEPQPTQLAGSELVAAVGELLQQTRDPERAAAGLRNDLRRQLSLRIGLPADADVDALADATGRTGADPDRIRAALDETRPVTDDGDLVRLAREIDAIRMEVLHDRHP